MKSTLRRTKSPIYTVVSIALFTPVVAFGAMYLQLDGIEGESTNETHPKWIEIDSMQWGESRPASAGPSRAGVAGRTCASDIVVSKPLDKSSIGIMNNLALMGKAIPKAKVSFTTNNGDSEQEYLLYELASVSVTGYSVASGGDRPSESVSLHFSTGKVTYKPVSIQGKVLSPVSTTIAGDGC